MSEEILEKLIQHDANFVQINQRFDEHDAKFLEHDRRFDKVDEEIDLLAQKSVEHDSMFEKLITMTQKHEERLDRIEANMATKSDISDIKQTLDYLVKLGEKHDQEMTMMSHGMLRLTERTERLEKHCGIT